MLKDIFSRFKKNPDITLCHYQIDTLKCRGCGRCKKVCKAGAISRERGKAYEIDEQKCIKCGVCMKWCGFKAIKKSDMNYENSKQ